MANSFSSQIISNTSKRTVIKLTGQLDANGANTVVIEGSKLPGALAKDANNKVLASAANANARSSYSYTISRVIYDTWIVGGYLTLSWDGVVPSPILVLCGSYDFNVQDDLGVITNNANTPNGNVILTTTGADANCGYSLMIEIHKTGSDWDYGQLSAPSDFQSGTYGIQP